MISLVIPTYNASAYLPALLQRLRAQTLEHELILIDSESDEATQRIFKDEHINSIQISKAEFNHGGTRNLGLQLAKYDTIVFMTQDALPASVNTLQTLVDCLYSRDDIVMAYGRQLPYPETGTFGRFARLINYPAQSIIKTKALIPKMGIKTCSCSNSFAVYRKSALLSIDGFPTDTILGEDVSVAARFILQDKALAYCAEAEVYHSHDYTIAEEFKRYFDIGVFHREQQAILSDFSQAESEGAKYIINEWKYLSHTGQLSLIPAQILRTVAKYVGYKLGRVEHKIPISVKRRISMHRNFWR